MTAPRTARATASVTAPVNSRLTCSIAEWVELTSTNLEALQFGQSAQPRPESVSRTRAPLTTMTNKKTSAAIVAMR